MKIINIEGCFDCPLLDENDFCDGWICNLKKDKIIKRDGITHLAFTPDWCPLKEQTVLLKLVE